jgi:FAD/FMN-containing dehydrogenase
VIASPRIGGAIAADIHGKNHHSHGSFGNHIVSMDLLKADGTIATLMPDGADAELFWATVGRHGADRHRAAGQNPHDAQPAERLLRKTVRRQWLS